MSPKVVIIILNWNGWEDTIECLESLYQIDYPNFEVVIADNGSKNDSIQKIEEYCKGDIEVESKFFKFDPNNKPISVIEYEKDKIENVNYKDNKLKDLNLKRKLTIIKNKKNYGFTKGNNIAINYSLKYLDPKYILLLNNDTVVDKHFLNELIDYGGKNKNVGFLGPKIYFYDFNGEDDIIQYAGAKQSLWLFKPENIGIFEKDEGQYDKIKQVDYIHGSCLLAKVEMIKEIGLLDETFFSYREENDWAIRGYNNRWVSLYVPFAKIWHKGGKSAGNLSDLTVFHLVRNDFILIKKHGNKLQIIIFFLYFFIFKLWFFSGIYLIYHKNISAFHSFLKGTKEGILWKRKE